MRRNSNCGRRCKAPCRVRPGRGKGEMGKAQTEELTQSELTHRIRIRTRPEEPGDTRERGSHRTAPPPSLLPATSRLQPRRPWRRRSCSTLWWLTTTPPPSDTRAPSSTAPSSSWDASHATPSRFGPLPLRLRCRSPRTSHLPCAFV